MSQQDNSITLSMEVSYPFHSHLIGRAGHNINRLMEQTKTRIHFPDGNRIAGLTKSNKVIVRGHMADVENVRHRIRTEAPVEFVVECRMEKIKQKGESSLIDYFSCTFGVLIRFYPKIDGVSCQVNIRGQHDFVDRLKDAVVEFCEITQTVLDAVVMKMETTFDHAWLSRDLLDQIIEKSGAGIRLPDVSVSAIETPKKNSIWLRGTMDAVYRASVMLNGLLPLQLMFQVQPNQMNMSLRTIAQKSSNADILFHAGSSNMDKVTVQLTSFEKNACQLYELSCLCLKLKNNFIFPDGLPSLWSNLETDNHFLPASKRYMNEYSAVNSSLPIPIARRNESPVEGSSSSPSECSFSTSLSPRMIKLESGIKMEPSVPASLSAARFDLNSYRQLAMLLETLGLSHYAEIFLTNEVDLTMFSTLTNQDFISIGISSFGARKIMLNAIQEIRR